MRSQVVFFCTFIFVTQVLSASLPEIQLESSLFLFTTVNTEYGPVKGVVKSSLLGRSYTSFQGIPFMKAPVGKLRFRDAQPPDKWVSELDAVKPPPSYTQFCSYAQKLQGQEDAGVINIFTPYISPKRLLPVMVFIHGGGFHVSFF